MAAESCITSTRHHTQGFRTNTDTNMSTVEARPSLRVDTHGGRSYTASSAISAGTFYSALGSASLDLPEVTAIQGNSDFNGGTKMGRTDSGFAENASVADESTSGGSPQDTVSLKVSQQHQGLSKGDALREPRKRSSKSNGETRRKSAPSTRSNSRDHTKSKTPSSSRASSNHRSTTRRNSSSKTAASAATISRPSLKRSFTTSGKPPAVPLRSISSTLPHRHAHNPFALHYKSCQLFQSMGSTLAYQDITAVSANADSLNSNSLASHYAPSKPVDNTSPSPLVHDSPDPELDASLIPHPVPQPTVIDWTSPSTRRREYAKIDRNSQGLRGWWRRNAPGWCFKGCRAGFYDGEKDSDAGSVRRYRLELPDENEDDDDDEDDQLLNEKQDGGKARARSTSERRWLGRTLSGFSGKRACGMNDDEGTRKTW